MEKCTIWGLREWHWLYVEVLETSLHWPLLRMFFSNNIFVVFVSQSIIAPIKSSALVVNLAVAHFYLGETLTNMDIGGSVAIVFGSLLSVFFGDRSSREINVNFKLWIHSSSNFESEQLREQFAEPPFLVYVAITAMFLGACFFFTKKIQERRSRVECKSDL